jgi:hypothetical protein
MKVRGFVATLAVIVAAVAYVAPHAAAAQRVLQIKTLSNRADLMSGGDALVEITGGRRLRVQLNGRDISRVFRRHNVGLVTGLRPGRNVLTVRAPDVTGAKLVISNYPIGGPIFGGAQVLPWVCATDSNGLGAPRDKQCNTPPVFTYQYVPVGGGQFAPYDPASPPPSDAIATTTTDQGVTVPYIVRVERGVIDRGIYDIAVLFDPSKPWTAVNPQAAWNHKLLIPGGAGCDPGHKQVAPPGVMKDQALSLGFAVLGQAMSDNTQNCNDVIQAEAVLMTKEHLIDTYGTVRYTIGEGASGGSMFQHSVAANYPGVLDGIQPSASFPDIWTTFQDMADCKLLSHYFLQTSPYLWANEQQRAWASGHLGLGTCEFMAEARSNSYVHASGNTPGPCGGNPWTYDAQANPRGARCGLQDYQIATFGKRKSDGYGRRPFDDVGVQFGLAALKAGQILPEQFVDLNEKVGGLDIDGNVSPYRSVADIEAVKIAYRTGRINNGRELAKLPIVDLRAPENAEEHYDFHTWQMRERIVRDTGQHANHVIWYHSPGGESFLLIDKWLAGVERDHSRASLVTKVRRHRPADAVDACWLGALKVTDMGTCTQVFPYYSNPRVVAGGPRTFDVMKCALRPLNRLEYGGAFSDPQWARLTKVFASGVCDWSKRGIGQQAPVGPWITFAGGPGGRPLGAPPVSRRL